MPTTARPAKRVPRGLPAQPMTFSDAVERLPLLTPAALLRGRSLIVVAPHPDDESLGCGGLLAWATQHDVPVRVIFLTNGEQSHPGSHCDVGNLRRAEAVCACSKLGVMLRQIHFLGWPDAGLETLASGERQQAVHALQQLIAPFGSSLVVTTAQTDPHGDHRAAFELVQAASSLLPDAELMVYPVWSWLLPEVSSALKGIRIGIAEQLPRKRLAIDAYASQHGLLPLDVDGFTLPQELLRHVHTGTEVFLSADL